MFIRRKRKMNISLSVAIVAALLLLATEVLAGTGMIHVVDTSVIPN